MNNTIDAADPVEASNVAQAGKGNIVNSKSESETLARYDQSISLPREFRYDPEVDIATIRVNGSQIVESDDTIPGVIIDLDAEGRTVGVEILDFAEMALGMGFARLAVPESAP